MSQLKSRTQTSSRKTLIIIVVLFFFANGGLFLFVINRRSSASNLSSDNEIQDDLPMISDSDLHDNFPSDDTITFLKNQFVSLEKENNEKDNKDKSTMEQTSESETRSITPTNSNTASTRMVPMNVLGEEFYPITIATKLNENACKLLYSALRNGINFNILGYGMEKFTLSQKIDITFEEIEKVNNPNAILMFLDAYDVVVLQHAEAIISKFLKKFPGYSAVYNAEMNCHPFGVVESAKKRWGGDPYCLSQYPPSPNRFRYLNSGAFIGRQSALLDLYKKILALPQDIKDDLFDDQGMTAYVWLTQARDYLTLDYKGDLFLSLLEVQAHEFRVHKQNNPPERNEDVTATHADFWLEFNTHHNYPATLHGNGWGKWTLFSVEATLPWNWKSLDFTKASDFVWINGEKTSFNSICSKY
ncbi:hypothetical protein C9374_001817 [Naegleria lovaniensis]|uniref:PLOD1-3-like GT domain-containing protein n=1 Tax=Naegleria lovaniensis TaxID=51637 RepID=A0AA88GRE7_NAELO|nr:uncharacterized protein C9374_001817 [Naegleria lovaniensis]KAG2387485.1 hypothetical protein C9374_001817 [Naegleria lovaniensis]